jgi:hypothetical protein
LIVDFVCGGLREDVLEGKQIWDHVAREVLGAETP